MKYVFLLFWFISFHYRSMYIVFTFTELSIIYLFKSIINQLHQTPKIQWLCIFVTLVCINRQRLKSNIKYWLNVNGINFLFYKFIVHGSNSGQGNLKIKCIKLICWYIIEYQKSEISERRFMIFALWSPIFGVPGLLPTMELLPIGLTEEGACLETPNGRLLW